MNNIRLAAIVTYDIIENDYLFIFVLNIVKIVARMYHCLLKMFVPQVLRNSKLLNLGCFIEDDNSKTFYFL